MLSVADTAYARYRAEDSTYQLLKDHLAETAALASLFLGKIDLSELGVLCGLLHDIGKGTPVWQRYLRENVETTNRREKIPHATAGGVYVARKLAGRDYAAVRELVAMCVMYHHGSGLPDMITQDGSSPYLTRLTENGDAADAVHPPEEAERILSDSDVLKKINHSIETYVRRTDFETGKVLPAKSTFYAGLLARYSSSCLIDADRTSSALFERHSPLHVPSYERIPDWQRLLEKLESHVQKFPVDSDLAVHRKAVSQRCAEFGQKQKGIYTLSAATGAGKTLSSLRFALTHAAKHKLDHIFIIAPYTSILDQNAKVIRDILEKDEPENSIVLECHSNVLKEVDAEARMMQTLLAETWNTPVVITTMVQFLESFFASGTQKIRRMHQLARSVVVFDEIQTLPSKCTYLFNFAVPFLVDVCGSTALLCTATQPAFETLDKTYALPLKAEHEIIPDILRHFTEFKRVDVIDKTVPGGYTAPDLCTFILNELKTVRSLLVVVNTKPQALELYTLLQSEPDGFDESYHLSTNMCPAHRRAVIGRISAALTARKRIICVSTRLIEAGIDISFDCAVRLNAGMDSIAQTAGRCNRNGTLTDEAEHPISGKTYIVNMKDERLGSLEELKLGQSKMERILREYKDEPERFGGTLLNPEIIKRYFTYYFSDLPAATLAYDVRGIRRDTLVDLLSTNKESKAAFLRCDQFPKEMLPVFRQAFKTAWKNFEVIEDNTVGVIVPYGEGERIIGKLLSLELRSADDYKRCYRLLEKAQQYTVNVFYTQLPEYLEKQCVREISLSENTSIYVAIDGYYDCGTGFAERFSGAACLVH